MTSNRTAQSTLCSAHRSASSWGPAQPSVPLPIAIAAVVVHVAVATLTWRDLANRDATDVRGPRNIWRAASALNTLGSLAYWAFGRVGGPASIDDVAAPDAWALLDHASIGRVAIAQVPGTSTDADAGTEPGIDIFPVNYLVHEGAIYFRSGPGAKLMEIAANPTVVFEVDGHRGSTHWSVIVHGRAERLGMDHDIETSRIHELVSDHPSEMSSFVRIAADSISGRRFRAARHGLFPQRSATAAVDAPITPGSQQPVHEG